jgi:DNA-binding NarL/FixJ family response regulator
MRRHALALADRIGEAVTVLDGVREQSGDPRTADLLEAGALGAGQLDLAVVRALSGRLETQRQRAADPLQAEPLTLAVAAAATGLGGGPPDETVNLAERALAGIARRHPDSDYSVQGQLSLAFMLAEQYDRAVDVAGPWIDDARRDGSVPRFISLVWLRSTVAYRVGALQDAEADARDALEAATLYRQHFWLPGAVAALINPLVEHGRLDEAEGVLAESQVEPLYAGSSSFCWAAWLLPARGRLRIAEGRTRDGLADLLTCGERHESVANRSPSLWSWRSEAALALAALGEFGRAKELAADEVELARSIGSARALGVALRAAGLVAGGADGMALLEEAVSTLAESAATLEHARALTDLGAARRRLGQRLDARLPLRTAVELAVRCGAEVLADRAREELLLTGAHPRRDELSGPRSLTPSEDRVARMAAAGRSNPEIAQELFLTRRTVETHLTHAYQKLGIRSRDELASAVSPAEPPGT